MANERSYPRRVDGKLNNRVDGKSNKSSNRKPDSRGAGGGFASRPHRADDAEPRRPSGPRSAGRPRPGGTFSSRAEKDRNPRSAKRTREEPVRRNGSRLETSSPPRPRGAFASRPSTGGAGKPSSYGSGPRSGGDTARPTGGAQRTSGKTMRPNSRPTTTGAPRTGAPAGAPRDPRTEGPSQYPDRHGRPADRPRRQRRGPSLPTSANRPNKGPTDRVRLNKYLAECGIASRRKADEIIGEGLITINGKKVFELGVKVNPREDRIHYRGKPLLPQTQFVYYAFNKPKAVVTSTSDPQGRPTVLDFFPKSKFRLFPVGRLDWDSEGLIFMTNDGEFSQKIIHPDEEVNKTYHVKLDGIPNDIHLDKLKKGVSIIGGRVQAISVRKLAKSTDTKGWIEIVIAEGKNHQVRQMFAKLGFDVLKLRRVAIGEFKLGNLESGKHRELTFEDLNKVFRKRPRKDADKTSVMNDDPNEKVSEPSGD